MKLFFILSAIALSTLPVFAAEAENTLEVWANRHQQSAAAGHPAIAVSAILKQTGDKHLLAFKFTNLSKQPIELYPFALPWGNPHSITVAAVTTEGKRLRNRYPIADPPPQKTIRIAPGASQEGEYDLSFAIEMKPEDRKQDILLLWSYRLSTGFPVPVPVCSGVVVIPKAR